MCTEKVIDRSKAAATVLVQTLQLNNKHNYAQFAARKRVGRVTDYGCKAEAERHTCIFAGN